MRGKVRLPTFRGNRPWTLPAISERAIVPRSGPPEEGTIGFLAANEHMRRRANTAGVSAPLRERRLAPRARLKHRQFHQRSGQSPRVHSGPTRSA